jgi:hypothetical protein
MIVVIIATLVRLMKIERKTVVDTIITEVRGIIIIINLLHLLLPLSWIIIAIIVVVEMMNGKMDDAMLTEVHPRVGMTIDEHRVDFMAEEEEVAEVDEAVMAVDDTK